MNFVSNITLNLYSIIILTVLLVYSLRQFDQSKLQNKLYLRIIQASILLLIMDILGRFDGNPIGINPYLNHFGNFMLFLISPLVPSLWVLYVYTEIFPKTNPSKNIEALLIGFFGINTAFLIISQFNHIYYFIDLNNIYHRGPLYLLSPLITFILISIAFFLLIKNRKRIDKQHYNALLCFAVAPVISIFYTSYIYGNSVLVNSVVISIMIVGLYIQSHNSNTDYLTGVSNRKKLDTTIRDRIRKSTKYKTFSAIMIDLDGFKTVNDSFGHDVGDAVLQKTARLLKDCLRTVDFIARYGGDEFCIVVDVSTMEELELIVDRLKSTLQSYNESGGHFYQVEMSMGYAVYDYEMHYDTEAFIIQLDELMYHQKREKKNAVKI